ncbi:uncharacterized protein PV06_08612 [Exophiala oligosperma]|uniref:Class II aldolase/adducin N-terminal domain-containing protein n=1 Tax=Exophiala oligosperma TaxID=215243 RepID=A0A0D2DX63_9EURO|nr:uncharacterized protein PV06_08612 [Exophiala oligosperma]KIW40059.1 hypothetical protein PV06_08612 [Exophiala oligosperma]
MSRNMAPGTVSSASDLVEYLVESAEAVDPSAPRGFLERYIHSEIYKRYPEVQSVIHSHSEAVVPFSINGVPMKPCYHMAGFLGSGAPVWDIADSYGTNDTRDMLICNNSLGSSLAGSFCNSDQAQTGTFPTNRVVLMRGHGFTALAESIEACVMTAIYTQKNAMIQTTAIITHAMYNSGDSNAWPIYLTKDEARDATHTNSGAVHRPWDLWCREVEACSLYRHDPRD